jgi:hypothetical protein
VHSDLASYISTQQNCDRSLFESRYQSFNHELEVHCLESICKLCPNTFSARKALEKHIEQQHAGIVSDSQISALVAQAGKTVQRIPASSCPLCDYDGVLRRRLNIVGVADQGSAPILLKPRAFQAHLGRHLEQLALFVLPKSELMKIAEPAVQSIAAQDGDVVVPEIIPSSDESEEDNRTLESNVMELTDDEHALLPESKDSAPESDEIHEELAEAPELAMGWLPPMNFTPPKSDFDVDDSDWAPRREDSMFGGDLFTPGWVRGYDKEKEGFCGRCEPGVWHKMVDLSYENDLTYRHGIDSSGIPLPRPSSIRPVEGKDRLWEGYCEDCSGWRTLRTTKMGWNWFRHCIKARIHVGPEDTKKVNSPMINLGAQTSRGEGRLRVNEYYRYY